jgi:hypothetical protein
MSTKKFVHVVALCAAAGTGTSALAQWVPNYQYYSIQRIGLFGPAQTGSGGLQNSSASFLTFPGFVAGTSNRYTGVSTDNGVNTWVYSPTTNTTVQTGLTGAAHTGSAGFQLGSNNFLNDAGQVAGLSQRITGVSTTNGQNTWVYNPAANTTVQTGLTSAAHTGSAGYQASYNTFQNAAGQVAGLSQRITGASTYNGRNTWVYNPTTNTTVQTGLTSAAHTGSTGYQVSDNRFQNAAGQVAGYSLRITGASTYNGENTWVYNPSTNTTVQMGLTGTAQTGSAGYQFSISIFQNAAGQVAGFSRRFTGVNTYNGQNIWIYNPAANTTVQTGLTSAAHTGSAGYQFSENQLQNAAGQVAGYSQRIIGLDTDNGVSTWVYSPTTNTTVQTGLTGAAHTGSAGYQLGGSNFLNYTGQVAGVSARITGVSTTNGQNTWVYNPAANTTVQTGLTSPAYTGSAGYQLGSNNFQNSSGQVAGFSRRITGVNTTNGQNTWVYSPTTNTTVQTGLTGAAYIGSAGFQLASNNFQNDIGQIAGLSQRFTGVNTTNGQNTWVYSPSTNITVQTGLTSATHTGSAGYQVSHNTFQNAAGQVAGYSQRITGLSTLNGQDVWYFDPVTNLTSAIVGSIRTSDNFAFSQPSILTEGGFLLGYYSYFAGGVNPAVDRAFIFRPDLGLTDLGNLVSGGLTLNGWTTLQRPVFSDALRTIVGYGYVTGQTSGQSVFVMVPTPGVAGLLGLGGVVALRRRRGVGW